MITSNTGISISLVLMGFNAIVLPIVYFWVKRMSTRIDELDSHKVSESECTLHRTSIDKDFASMDRRIMDHTDRNSSEHQALQKAMDQMARELGQVSNNLELTAGSLVTVSDCLGKIAKGKEC